MKDINQSIRIIKTLELPQKLEESILDIIEIHAEDSIFQAFIDALIEWARSCKEKEIKSNAYDQIKTSINAYQNSLQDLINQWNQKS